MPKSGIEVLSCETPFQKGNFQAFIPENRSQLLLQGHFQRPFVLISDFLPFQLSSPALCKRLQGKALPTKRWIRGFGALSTASFLLLIPVGALGGTRDSWGKQENRPPAPPSPLPPFPSAARPPELLQPHSPLRGRRRAGAVVPTRLRGAHRGPILLKSPPPGPHLGVPLAWHTQRRGVPEAPSHTLVSQVFKL